MEIDSDNVAEIEKYAFLLGSAIKNEDTEQFFSIYDSILPRDLPDNQLEEIKERARKVVALSDSDFNNLVLRARHYSLAPAGTAMTCRRESPSQKWTQPAKDEDSEEDDGFGSRSNSHNTGGKSDTSSLYSTTKNSRLSEGDTRRHDDDSGVCNSSKATNSIGSWSDRDASEDEGRGVSFDYFPPQVKIRSGCGLNLDYDEAHEVKSDNSSPDFNSPRSDLSEPIEMKTFSSRQMHADDDDDEFNFQRDVKYQDDFNTSGESEDETSYRNKYYNLGYRPLNKDTPNFQPRFESRHSWDSELTTSSLRTSDVDRGIYFSSLKDGTSQYSRHSTYPSSSDSVKIKSNSYRREKKDPPFGRGPEQLDNVASSIDRLINGRESGEVKNMPEGRKLEPLTPEDTKKKRKKKKHAKDDASVATDENGNPIVETRALNPGVYKQMRESPTSGSGTVANSHFDASYGTFSHHLEQYGARSYSSRDIDNDSIPKPLRRRKKKLEKLEPQKKAEDIENYKGDRPIDELISFIGGQNESSKKAKKNSSVLEDIPSKTQKSNKKNKDKKQKSPSASDTVDEAEIKGRHTAQLAVLHLQDGEEMGNSSGKTDVEIPVENGDIDGLYSKKDRLAKSLLKENDKIDLSKTAIDMNSDSALNVICRESVKEKEPSSTNNKRDIVTGTGIENNKKKSEKLNKASKGEMSEMTISKSEETLKLDAILPNNVSVKQKNAKNKKSKPTSPTVKMEGDNLSPEINQAVLAAFPTEETLADDTFMFTDLYVPQVPKEDEFQIVGKKKKKVTKEVTHQNHFIPNNGTNKPVRRPEEKRLVLSHSSYKASVPSNPSTTAAESDTRLRDLSPSAFPALSSGKGRQSIQDGRRNSTGDVPIPSELKSQDDSDLESVKSLPATQGSQTLDSILSPRLSYAKMAAGSKAPSSVSSSDKRSSLDSGDSDHEHKKSLWKGSPTERRHSIGSSPEVLNKVTGSPASVTASVKAGSQDHILTDVVITIEKTKMDKPQPSSGSGKHEVQNIERNHVGGVKTVLNNSPSEKSGPAKVFSASSLNPPSVSPNKSADNVVNSVSAPQQQAPAKQQYAYNNDHEMNSSSSVSKNLSSVTNSNVHKQETSKVKQNGSNGSKKQKSVIFLDKRVEESVESLGISFGFEIENLVKIGKTESMSFVKTDIYEQKSHESDTSPDKEVSVQAVELTHLVEPKDDNVSDGDNFSNTSSNHSVILNSNSNTEIHKSSSSDDRIDQERTVPAQLVRMNGIVNPQGHSSNNSKEVKEDISIKFAGGGETIHKASIPDDGLNAVYVYYGESVVTLKKDVIVPSLTNGPTSYCGKLQFAQETDLPSNFNLAEAAAFLSREWERTVQLQDKGPEGVHVHHD